MLTAVIPAYNIAPFISIALDSLLDQDPPFREIIVVDDGSTDRTPEILGRYSDRIRVVAQQNQRLGGARNTGIEWASSKYAMIWRSLQDPEN
ncbi:MAG TPA: glycosyltransferase family A protein [Acidobacteriaceae bacterium]|nr:glycosyltransferase family A protein [Acidobacteriaceae bacterium]